MAKMTIFDAICRARMAAQEAKFLNIELGSADLTQEEREGAARVAKEFPGLLEPYDVREKWARHRLEQALFTYIANRVEVSL